MILASMVETVMSQTKEKRMHLQGHPWMAGTQAKSSQAMICR